MFSQFSLSLGNANHLSYIHQTLCAVPFINVLSLDRVIDDGSRQIDTPFVPDRQPERNYAAASDSYPVPKMPLSHMCFTHAFLRSLCERHAQEEQIVVRRAVIGAGGG